MKEFYNPKTFIIHAAWLRQAFAHCARFPTAASRRSLGRVSVPMWLAILSDQLLIVALVSRYLNQLANQTRAALKAINLSPEGHIRHYHPFPGAIPNLKARSHVLLTRPPLTPKGPFDLHVLGLPPAFALSQDQTLRLS